MALTSTQRAQTRYYLGYSDVSQGGAPNQLERAMSDITSGAETILTGLLTSLATVDSNLVTAQGSTRAGIIEVDNGGVKWSADGMSSVRSISAAGRMYVTRLAAILGVPVYRDVFGAQTRNSGPAGRG